MKRGSGANRTRTPRDLRELPREYQGWVAGTWRSPGTRAELTSSRGWIAVERIFSPDFTRLYGLGLRSTGNTQELFTDSGP